MSGAICDVALSVACFYHSPHGAFFSFHHNVAHYVGGKHSKGTSWFRKEMKKKL
uniref:Uncharacterized protein n=1 Tax=Anguilla anguilla TaxID=7936 RepID=A0A0E9U9L3_ANGAN